MPTPRKLVYMKTKHMSKAQRTAEEEAAEHFKAGTDELTPPDWLPEEGKKEFCRVVKNAERLGMLDNLDLAELVIYAKNWSLFVSASKNIHTKGMVYKKTALSPYILVAEKAENAIHKCSAKLGLAAVDRTRLVKPQAEDKPANKYEKFLNEYG